MNESFQEKMSRLKVNLKINEKLNRIKELKIELQSEKIWSN